MTNLKFVKAKKAVIALKNKQMYIYIFLFWSHDNLF